MGPAVRTTGVLIFVSITVNYGGTTPHAADVQGALAEIARHVFEELNG
jgi:hypothetical protein